MKSTAGYWIGCVLLLIAVIGSVAWLLVSLRGVASTVDSWVRVDLPAETTVQLEARKYVVFYESPTASEEFPPSFKVQVFDAKSGAQVPVAAYFGSFTYDFGRQGSAQGTVTPPHAGAYRIVTTTETDSAHDNVAFGGSIGSIGRALFRAVGGSITIGGVLALLGLILLVTTAVRRLSAHRLAAA